MSEASGKVVAGGPPGASMPRPKTPPSLPLPAVPEAQPFDVPLAEGQEAVMLSSPARDLVAAASGRLLILHLAEEQQLAVFDVSKRKVIKTIPAEDIQIKFAAGQDRLIVIHGFAKMIEVWDLNSLERLKRTDLPVKGAIRTLVMGAGSNGPALLVWGESTDQLAPLRLHWLSPSTLDVTEVTGSGQRRPRVWRDNAQFRASANGRAFSMWSVGVSPAGIQTFLVDDAGARFHYQHSSAGSHLAPGPDGKYLFTGAGVFTTELVKFEELGSHPTIPALSGNYYVDLGQRAIDFRIRRDEPPVPPKVFVVGKPKPVAVLPPLNLISVDPPRPPDFGRDALTLDRRIFLIPHAQIMAHLPLTNDRIVLTKLQLE